MTADVAEADIAEVAVGQTATVTLSASGETLDATVTAVDAIETVTNNVVEYGVTVTIDKPQGLRLGQSTQVVVTTGTKAGRSPRLQQRADHDRRPHHGHGPQRRRDARAPSR